MMERTQTNALKPDGFVSIGSFLVTRFRDVETWYSLAELCAAAHFSPIEVRGQIKALRRSCRRHAPEDLRRHPEDASDALISLTGFGVLLSRWQKEGRVTAEEIGCDAIALVDQIKVRNREAAT